MRSKEDFLKYIQDYYSNEDWSKVLDLEEVSDVFVIKFKKWQVYKGLTRTIHCEIGKEFETLEEAEEFSDRIRNCEGNFINVVVDSVKIVNVKPMKACEKDIIKNMLENIDTLKFPISLP